MNHEETKQRIQELVPSVMELEEGCIIKGGGTVMKGGWTYWDTPSGNTCVDNFDYIEDEIGDILGKPITIGVVLLALEKKNKARLELTVIEWGDILGFWNLSKDNFNDQSEETKTFIGGLLTNN